MLIICATYEQWRIHTFRLGVTRGAEVAEGDVVWGGDRVRVRYANFAAPHPTGCGAGEGTMPLPQKVFSVY